MFKKLMKQLEEDNLSTNGAALRETLRDVSSNVMKQVKDKIESASASGSRDSSRAASLIDFGGPSSPDQEIQGASKSSAISSSILPASTSNSASSSQYNLHPSSNITFQRETSSSSSHQQSQPSFHVSSPHEHPRPDQPDISKIQEQLVMIKRERDSLHLRNSQLCNLIEDLKRELAEERILRKDVEEDFKRRSEDIPFKVLLDKTIQTDNIEEVDVSGKVPIEEFISLPEMKQEEPSIDRHNETKERDSLMTRNTELSNTMEKLKRQIHENAIERKEMEDELTNLKQSLNDKDALIIKKQQEFERLQQSLFSLESVRETLQKELSRERLERQQEHKSLQELHERLQEEQNKKQTITVQEDVVLVSKHNEAIAKLEESLAEKNKTIRLQQQRITDIKKSIQRGDFGNHPSNNHSVGQSNHNNQGGYWSDSDNHQNKRPSSPATLPVSGRESVSPSSHPSLQYQTSIESSSDHAVTTLSVNFEYLKNVIYKFITSSDYESQKQLIKAIATLLQFNREQENAVRETLEWRNSWVYSIPLVASTLKPVSAVTSTSSSTTTHKTTPRRNRSRSRGKK